MTRPIEETLNLPKLDDALAAVDAELEAPEEETDEELSVESELDDEDLHSKISDVKEMRASVRNYSIDTVMFDDTGMNTIQEKAMTAYQDLLDSGFACDPRHASNFLEPALQALGIALDSEKAKLNKKLDTYRIQIQMDKTDLLRRRVELEERKQGTNLPNETEEGYRLDRNELLKKLVEDDK